MRQRFKAREFWLFAPFLLIIAGALYWQRIEQVSKPGAHGMYVSDFKVEPAPGYWQEQGYSHQVITTISHPWPRPKWWGQQFGMQLSLFPLHPEKFQSTIKGSKRDQYVEAGAVLTVKQNGKVAPYPKNQSSISYNVRFDGSGYVFEHRIKGSEIPTDLGAVTFRGLYRIADNGLLPIAREIRKAGETLPMKPNKNSGARLTAINATPFFVSQSSRSGGKVVKEDNCWVQFHLRDMKLPTTQTKSSAIAVYGIEIQDETGKIIRPYSTKGLTQGTMSGHFTATTPLPADEKLTGIDLDFDPQLKTKGRLILRGKVSFNWNWPINFEVTLPPRDQAQNSLSRTNAYSIPLWRDGKPVEVQ